MSLEPPVSSDHNAGVLNSDTAVTRRRYDRVARFYDLFEAGMEGFVRPWRARLWAKVPVGKIIEVGIGTGKNMPFYPKGAEITGIDLSSKMLERAHKRASRLGITPMLTVADVQALPYPSHSFDTAITTCVFCSVPDPVRGLREIRRVLKPGGQLLMLEHVLSHRPALGRLMNFFDAIPFHLWGAHINRNTVRSVELAGFTGIGDENLALDVVKYIRAEAPLEVT